MVVMGPVRVLGSVLPLLEDIDVDEDDGHWPGRYERKAGLPVGLVSRGRRGMLLLVVS